MELKNKKIILELINKYGIEKVKEMLEINKQFLIYMHNLGKTITNRKQDSKLYSENEKGFAYVLTKSSDKQLLF